MSRTTIILREEHRSLVTVVHCMQSVIGEIETKGSAPDFALFHAALNYLTTFLYEFHHPKETNYLFPALRRRAPARAAIIEDLERQHLKGEALIQDIKSTLDHYESGEDGAFERFKAAVETYRAFEWAHIRLEEKSIIPLADACLTEADWGKIDTMFLDYQDPIFGEKRAEEFKNLFHKIVDVGPFRFNRRGN